MMEVFARRTASRASTIRRRLEVLSGKTLHQLEEPLIITPPRSGLCQKRRRRPAALQRKQKKEEMEML